MSNFWIKRTLLLLHSTPSFLTSLKLTPKLTSSTKLASHFSFNRFLFLFSLLFPSNFYNLSFSKNSLISFTETLEKSLSYFESIEEIEKQLNRKLSVTDESFSLLLSKLDTSLSFINAHVLSLSLFSSFLLFLFPSFSLSFS